MKNRKSMEPMGEEYIYYNAKLYNNTNAPLLATLNDTRARSILASCCDYKCSIIRFSVNGSLLPLLVPKILNELGPPPYITNYSVTLSFGGFSFVAPVVFTAPTNNQVKLAYYYFNAFIDDLNNAFQAAYTGLTGLVAVPAPNPPVMVWNPQTQLFTLFFNEAYITNNIIISMNYDLFNLFQSFQTTFNGYFSAFGRDNDLIISSNNTIGAPFSAGSLSQRAASLTAPFVGLQQEFSSLTNWSPVATFYFTSYQIPIRNENLPIVTSNNQSVIVNNNVLPVITDFEPVLGSDSEFNRGQTQYVSVGTYRYLTLESDVNLNTIDLQCYWTDKEGKSFPLLLDLGYYISVKLLFEMIKK
jgi:hypothetical protein